MKTLNSYDFENMLQDDYFSGNEVEEINRDIESRLTNDADFAKQYESWSQEVRIRPGKTTTKKKKLRRRNRGKTALLKKTMRKMTMIWTIIRKMNRMDK